MITIYKCTYNFGIVLPDLKQIYITIVLLDHGYVGQGCYAQKKPIIWVVIQSIGMVIVYQNVGDPALPFKPDWFQTNMTRLETQ